MGGGLYSTWWMFRFYLSYLLWLRRMPEKVKAIHAVLVVGSAMLGEQGLISEQGCEPVFLGFPLEEGGDQVKLEFKTFVLQIERQGEERMEKG